MKMNFTNPIPAYRCKTVLVSLILTVLTGCASITSTSMATSEEASPVVEVKSEKGTTSSDFKAPSKAATAVVSETKTEEKDSNESTKTEDTEARTLCETIIRSYFQKRNERCLSETNLSERDYKQHLSTTIKEIVYAATTFGYGGFPSAVDILAIISVESSFNSKASYRGSKGLMQIHVPAHGKNFIGKNIFDVKTNIEYGSDLLYEYYVLLGRNRKAAILAYNAGIGNYLKGRYNIEYWHKYQKALMVLSSSP